MIVSEASIYFSTLAALIMALGYMAKVILSQNKTIAQQDDHHQGPLEIARQALNIMADVKTYIGASTEALKAHESLADQRSKDQTLILKQSAGTLTHLSETMPQLIEAGVKPVLEAHAEGKQQILSVLGTIREELQNAQDKSQAAFAKIGGQLDSIEKQLLTSSEPVALAGATPEGGEGEAPKPETVEPAQV